MSGICSIWHSGARWRWEHSLYQYHLIHDRCSLPSVQRALYLFQGWGLAIVQWASHPSWEMRFTQCAISPSSIIKIKFSQCSVGPSSLLRDDVYLLCAVAPHPWLNLKDEVYLVCNQPLIPERWSLPVCNQPLIPPESWGLSGVRPPLIPPERRSLPSVQPAPHPSQGWGLPTVQWAPHPFWEIRVWPVRSEPLIPPKD